MTKKEAPVTTEDGETIFKTFSTYIFENRKKSEEMTLWNFRLFKNFPQHVLPGEITVKKYQNQFLH